jgi:hypothetical protein
VAQQINSEQRKGETEPAAMGEYGNA